MLFVSSFKRKFKEQFFRMNLYKLLSPFNSTLLKLYYLGRQGEWIDQLKGKNGFNDFYSGKYDFMKMFGLFRHISESELSGTEIDYLEFGVFKGRSIKWWVENKTEPGSWFYGFDTFKGLPEDFGEFKKGSLSADDQLPSISDKRCIFYKGLFQETLPVFLKTYTGTNRKVIHIDCDLYSSTLFVLSSLAPRLNKNDIVIFDEFVTPTQEFKAFDDFISAFYINYEFVGAVNNYHQTAIKIV
jgi:O-methyltransferase